MPSIQSTLGEEEGIAEELAESQRQISIAEFFEKNKHMLGFDSGARALVTAVKEAVDNALDATEEAGIKPDIYVEIDDSGDYYTLVVEDNGPGITKEQLPKVFGKLLYGSRFHAREQSRGQQGIGISAAVLYSQLTSGKPAKITSKTEAGSEQYFELIIDTDENEPEIKDESDSPPAGKHVNDTHGTRIELEMEGNMRARQQLQRYIKHTAVVNPHARIEYREPGMDEPQQFRRADGAELPAETEEIRPHPHGVELGTVLKMLASTDSHSVSGFVQEEFTRVGRKTADSILDNFRDRHFGREAAWQPPQSHEKSDLARAVANAVSNKSADATAAFGDEVAEAVTARNRVAHSELVEIVTETAESVGEDYGETFGDTVQENAVEAAWERLTEGRTSDLYQLVDKATSTRKDDETVHGLAERLAKRFEKGRERDRATHDELREYVDKAADQTEEYDDATVGDTARENVVMEVWNTMVTVPDAVPKVGDFVDDRDMSSDLLEAMTETDIISPPTNCLSPITAELVEAGLKKEFDADFYAASTRDADVHGGDPFIVEAGIAYGGELEEDGKAEVLRFANRVPLVYQRGACATTDVVKSIGWRNYNLSQPGGSGIPNGPAVIMVHVASTNVPFTSESKDAIANVPEIEDEIELAIREAARELKSYLNKRKSLQKRKKKQNVIASILPEMAEKLADVTGQSEPQYEDALARIMNNVLVEREVEDGTVKLSVENNSSTNASPEITDIVSVEPRNLSDGATAVDMDGEWFVKWSPTVGSGDEAVLEYEVEGEPTFDPANVEGIEDPKLTNNS
ncbi:DNA topoisomerase VI subunit B [Halorussus gelatinilyticus]|uniref:Type 2 DNA topoisomerase 6 subunit B n=1 Tax=Halorussus gelatinilyticus TaxID=2937524 RepID=A0A8U0IG58_9EURY|nr:DNA topoisomerase VI subunit B [Halorussus gelatinilyticus]UPV99680.1 DNA topoisomerase VI subunit B [Halorussus gelatinilyticus]